MTVNNLTPNSGLADAVVGRFLRLAAGGLFPASLYQPKAPLKVARARKQGPLNIEVVSHCWRYAHLLNYQLSSLVQFPPQNCHVTMTVYYAGEDEKTSALLAHFASISVPGVTWNWRELPRPQLFRRAIGRNHAALNTQADWIWFTDCDLMFREGCWAALVEQLQGRDDALVFPRQERITPLLAESDPMLAFDPSNIGLVDIDDNQFTVSERGRATGPLQITHGDVARAVGYCNAIKYYQQPSETWCKAHEDRAFRWLLRTQGVPLDIPGVYRIRHVFKGRYTGSKANTGLRTWLRRLKSWLTERRKQG